MLDSTDEDDDAIDIFQEPPSFRQPEKPFTFQSVTIPSGITLQLRLVGHNPLWGHLLWNAGRTLSNYLTDHAPRLVHDRTVLELGAGAGLPSLTCALSGAKGVVVTDYPDADLIENLSHNIATNLPTSAPIRAAGYIWGAETNKLADLLPGLSAANRFDTLILADLLFNHICHRALLQTITSTLALTQDARALVFFTPYRPWLLEKDLAFFDLLREEEGLRLEAHEVGKWMMDTVLFADDPGDEELRRTVFGYEVCWKQTYLDSLPNT